MIEEKPCGSTADPATQAGCQPDKPAQTGTVGQPGPAENENVIDFDSPLSEDYSQLDSDDDGPPPGWAPEAPSLAQPEPDGPGTSEAPEVSEPPEASRPPTGRLTPNASKTSTCAPWPNWKTPNGGSRKKKKKTPVTPRKVSSVILCPFWITLI